MGQDERAGMSGRLRAIREQAFGARGQARFARALGISPSTYSYYEKGRDPPAALLGRAAEVTGASLEWLLTGRGRPFESERQTAGDTGVSQPVEEALARFADRVGRGPRTEAALAALRALLDQVTQAMPAGPTTADWEPCAVEVRPTYVPIIGRTAAGLTANWDEFFAGRKNPHVMEGLLRRVEGRAAKQRPGDLHAADPQREATDPAATQAALVQLSAPTREGIAEFVDLPGQDRPEPGLFGLRVDGDSMAPRIRDGDIVLSRRDAAPLPGQTALVKLRDRIGLTVKLWRPEGDRVHLVPVNEAYEPVVALRSDVLWACRVLWVARF
jgi:SOS-response transcriptional repressor LexA/transcriptional regulator with XRE-family HTH domain